MLHNVSLDIRPGERLALVGPSGGGKTTLCNLLPRFYEVTSGRILIDGQDIGIVQQDVYLFSGTVAQNIAYGKPGATREEIMEAARLAGAEKFILALKDGFDTYVGERGVKLSGGQKQRIAIAGILAMEPECIVLDEATAMLDPAGRREVIDTVRRLNRERGITVVLITHHMAEAESADRVIVMNDGQVAMDGAPHDVFAQVDRLHELGLAAPDTVELLHLLRETGIDVPLTGLTVDECADTICRAFGGAEGE